MAGVGVPGWANRVSLAWKLPPVPGNPFQMFSPTGRLSRSSGELKSQRWKAEPASDVEEPPPIRLVPWTSSPLVLAHHHFHQSRAPLLDSHFFGCQSISGSSLSDFNPPVRDNTETLGQHLLESRAPPQTYWMRICMVQVAALNHHCPFTF